ncbi:hypothetical protein [Streptomyces sp. NPDC046332]|uniref:hypothetical protein n=1 Tax=Streptomyces sp. NPDC046332 TaxID=3155133 RepID=UPI0033FD6465
MIRSSTKSQVSDLRLRRRPDLSGPHATCPAENIGRSSSPPGQSFCIHSTRGRAALRAASEDRFEIVLGVGP